MITYLAGIWLILVDCSAWSFLFMLFWKIFWFGTEKSRWYTMLGAPANQGEWKKKKINAYNFVKFRLVCKLFDSYCNARRIWRWNFRHIFSKTTKIWFQIAIIIYVLVGSLKCSNAAQRKKTVSANFDFLVSLESSHNSLPFGNKKIKKKKNSKNLF